MRRQAFTLLIFAFFLSTEAIGQNEFFFNHYMFNPTYFNPAWAAIEDEGSLYAIHRSQWVGYSATFDPGGPPTTQLVTLTVPSRLPKFSGFGLTFVNDQVAEFNTIDVRSSIAIRQKIGVNFLHIGLSPSLTTKSIRNNFRAVDNPETDPLIPNQNITQTKANFHLGFVYSTQRELVIGLAIENLIEPNFDFNTAAENKLPRNYNVFVRKTLGVSRDLIFEPSILLRSDLKAYSFDLSGVFRYQESMWAGLAFRRAESLGLLLGYSFLSDNKLSVGYSFDYVVAEQEAKQPTSHELLIRYRLPNLVLGGKKAVKTPRFVF
jgi:type IX secretion system PorP/SprF family membrane protein